jgi:transcriptional regulator with XRE-family HTH domain
MTCTRCDRPPTRRGMCHRCYENHRNRQKLYGRWESSRVPAEPIRQHVQALRAAGVGSRRVEQLSGVSRSVIQALMNGRSIYGNQPSKTISAENAQRILAVEVKPAAGCPVDITGTTRRLQALVAIGYTQADLAARVGITAANATELFRGNRSVLLSTAIKVRGIYEELSMRPGPSDAARQRAKKLRWAPPLAWEEDTIDNPQAKPDLGERRAVKFDERFLEMRELGFSDLEILQRLNVKAESLMRQLERYGIPASPELATIAASQKWRKQVAS